MSGVCPGCCDWSGWLRCLLVALPSTWLSISALAACPADDDLRSYVVFLKACTPSCSEPPSQQTKATGVLVSENGLILSVYDLLGTLHAYKSGYQVIASRKTGLGVPNFDAAVVGIHEERGLLLLKVEPENVSDMGLKAAKIGQAPTNSDVTLCSIGYRENIESAVRPNGNGRVISSSWHRHYAFETDFNFAPVQQGSPVFGEDGLLVGIASGFETGGGQRSHVIPIEYSDVLLAQVFIGDLKERLAILSGRIDSIAAIKNELGGLSSQVKALEGMLKGSTVGQNVRPSIGCKSVVLGKTNSCRFAVACEKPFAGPPYIEVGDFRVEADYTDKTGASGKKTEPWQSTVQSEEFKTAGAAAVNAPPQIQLLKNTFCLDAALENFAAQKSRYGWRSIQNILISVKLFARYDDQSGTELELITLPPTPYPGSGN